MQLTESLKTLFKDTANRLAGADRRIFIAQTVRELGVGGQRRAERELGWNRTLIRKGERELASGITCIDNVHARGRKRVEQHLPNLLHDIRALADSESQADPQLRHARLYTRLTAKEVRRQLIALKGYTDEQLPCQETIRIKLNELGFVLRQVQKTLPQKKLTKLMRSLPSLHTPTAKPN